MGLLRGFRAPRLKVERRPRGAALVEPWEYAEPVAVRAIGPSAVWVRFEDGTEHELELGGIMVGPGFKAIFDADQFDQVGLADGTIAWPNGMDIAPETIYWAKYNGKSLLREPSESPTN